MINGIATVWTDSMCGLSQCNCQCEYMVWNQIGWFNLISHQNIKCSKIKYYESFCRYRVWCWLVVICIGATVLFMLLAPVRLWCDSFVCSDVYWRQTITMIRCVQFWSFSPNLRARTSRDCPEFVIGGDLFFSCVRVCYDYFLSIMCPLSHSPFWSTFRVLCFSNHCALWIEFERITPYSSWISDHVIIL